MVADRWLWGGRTRSIVSMMCRSCWVTRLKFAHPVITFSLWFPEYCRYGLLLHSAAISCFCVSYFVAYVFCHTGVSVCLFVVNVTNFWYAVIENRLSNSKLHYEFTVLYFWLLFFVWDPSTSFQNHFCCSYCFVYSFLFGTRLCRL